MFRDLERAQTVFTGIAAHVVFGANLAYQGQTMNGDGMLVSGSYFPVLGLQPALGRLLTSNDDRAVGESPVVVLSHGYWQTRFGSNPNVLNQQLIVNGQHLTIVGVAPRGFEGTSLGVKPEVFVPITLRAAMRPGSKPDFFTDRRSYWAYLFARLKPGMTIEQARTGINVPYRGFVNDVEAPLQEGMSEQTMASSGRRRGAAEGMQGQSSVHGEARAPLILLLGVTALVLVIACANIANLLLARSAKRAAEMAVRLSIGASRWQLVVQLLTESVLLAALGGLAGLAVAQWTLTFIAQLLPEGPSGTVPTELDTTVLVFAAVLTLGTGLLFGLFPALYSTRPDLATTLKGSSGQPSGARGAARFRATLATAQIALSMMLLVSAGLFTKSLFNITRVDLGLKPDHLATFGISPQLNAYTAERSKVLFERLEDALASQPGVTSVTASTVPALGGLQLGHRRARAGLPVWPGHRQQRALQQHRARILPDDGHPVDRGTRVHARGHAGIAEGGDRQRSVPEEVPPRTRRGRQVHVAGWRRKARHRDRGRGQGREVLGGEARGAAAVLPAVSPDRTGRRRSTSTCGRRWIRRRWRARCRRSWRGSIRTCRSKICARWSSR